MYLVEQQKKSIMLLHFCPLICNFDDNMRLVSSKTQDLMERVGT